MNDDSEPMAATETQLCELQIRGMTCAACMRRVERALTSVPGVREAHVNLVMERATGRFAPGAVEHAALSAAVAAAGYEMVEQLRAKAGRERGEELARREREEDRVQRRELWVSVLLSVPLLALGMSHGALPLAGEASGRGRSWSWRALSCWGRAGECCGWAFARSGMDRRT